jgi:hypothetical protein
MSLPNHRLKPRNSMVRQNVCTPPLYKNAPVEPK